jgi:hypothetical protein
MASWVIPSWVTGELLQRFVANLEGAAAENYGNKPLDGTITVPDTTDSKGQNVLRVVVAGRTAGPQGGQQELDQGRVGGGVDQDYRDSRRTSAAREGREVRSRGQARQPAIYADPGQRSRWRLDAWSVTDPQGNVKKG